jgi:probable HAF family extracellular repeat protein
MAESKNGHRRKEEREMTHTSALKLVVFGMLGLPMLRADAFLDVNGVFTTIAVPGAGDTTVARSINDLGQIAGWFTNSSGVTQGFVDTNGVFTTFGAPPYGGSATSFVLSPFDDLVPAPPVTGINDAGQVVGNFNINSAMPPGPYAFVYANGVYTILEVLSGANGINDSGQIISFGESAGFFASEIFGPSGIVNLIYPGALSTDALAINNAGEVVVVVDEVGTFSDFLWVNGTFTPISLPGTPSGINDSGQIIGNAGEYGYLDTNGVIQTIDVPGSTGTVAYGINDAGDIVGTFTPAVVPEPASLVLAAAGLTGIALLKRYRPSSRSSKPGEASSGVCS